MNLPDDPLTSIAMTFLPGRRRLPIGPRRKLSS